MRWRAALALAVLAGLGAQAGCSRSEKTRIVLTGSSTIAPLMTEIGRRYEAKHPDVRVDVQSGGSSRGVADARQGQADVGMVSRALKPDEADLTGTPIARDGIALIVHRDNPVQALSRAQVVGIYTGQIKRWSAVGGADRDIVVVNKAEGRSTLELFLSHFQLKNEQIAAQVVIGDNEQGIKTVAGNPDAVGYVSIGTAEYDAGRGVPIRLLPLEGVEATHANVQAGRFPLSRVLLLVTKGEPSGPARQLIEFARSAEVRDLVEQQSFVPLAP
ncbi:MAG: phosphate ABC transporter substrate-binding protein [Myxococcales bacterium]|nr:phosphate ABC transporter substrate-binding protein [Myxococcales bacterium]